MSRTEHQLLKMYRKQESTLASKHAKMLATIHNRALEAEQDLHATVGAELERVRAGIAELEAKQEKPVEV